jgi:hypothetical protein
MNCQPSKKSQENKKPTAKEGSEPHCFYPRSIDISIAYAAINSKIKEFYDVTAIIQGPVDPVKSHDFKKHNPSRGCGYLVRQI